MLRIAVKTLLRSNIDPHWLGIRKADAKTVTDIYDELDGPSKYMLDVQEVLDEIKSKFYELEAGAAEWEDEVRERISV